MVILRKSQMDLLRGIPQKQFKDDMVNHLKRFDPILCGSAGEKALSQFVDMAYERTLALELNQKFAVTAFIEILFTLGCEFQSDPQYYWLRPFVKSIGGASQDEHARLLQFHVVRYLEEVHGAGSEHGLAALEKIRGITGAQLDEIAVSYSQKAPAWLESLHPNKCAFIGGEATASLAEYARQEAERNNCKLASSVPVLLGLMFSFGSGILRDPLYSWVPETFSRPEVGEKRLLSRTKAYFHIMKNHLQKAMADVVL
jgi:hypothetical protein